MILITGDIQYLNYIYVQFGVPYLRLMYSLTLKGKKKKRCLENIVTCQVMSCQSNVRFYTNLFNLLLLIVNS